MPRGEWLRLAQRLITLPVLVGLVAVGCEMDDPALLPDEELRAELGLTLDDRVYTISLTTGVGERAEPDSLLVEAGDYVQFVSSDWLVHEMAFELDSLPPPIRRFLEQTGQTESPPLLQRNARFVLALIDAPPGRYPFILSGNRDTGRGVIVVAPPAGLP